MNATDFETIARILKERSGLALGKEKAYLLESRLSPVARKWGFASFDDLIQAVRGRADKALLVDVTEAMMTNESFFFRDQRPFEQFRDVILPELLRARAARRHIRIWCAACSSGQEPYSLAMILKEQEARLAGWTIEILGTDISRAILAKAREGLYSQFEVQRGLPINLLVKHFTQTGERWQIDQQLRRMVRFDYFNLLDDPKPLGRFDVVYCRNVLIYFDQPTKARVLDNISGQMAKDGFLVLGGAETVLGTSNAFGMVPGQRGIYRVADARSATKAAG